MSLYSRYLFLQTSMSQNFANGGEECQKSEFSPIFQLKFNFLELHLRKPSQNPYFDNLLQEKKTKTNDLPKRNQNLFSQCFKLRTTVKVSYLDK